MKKGWFAFVLVTILVCVYGQPVKAMRIEENDPSVTYTGTWYTNSASPNSGSQAFMTNEKGATAAISFNGTGIIWNGVLDAYSGLANVYLDGTLYVIDTYGSATQYQQPLFEVHGLAPGNHRLSISVLHLRDDQTSGSWIWIDNFDVDNGSGIPGGVVASGGRIEQNDPSIGYAGKWFSIPNPILSGGNALQSVDPGSRATVRFNGTGISLIGYRDAWSGVASVFLDGAFVAEFDLYSPADQSQSVVFRSKDLPAGEHSLMIQVAGIHNNNSRGSWVWIDAFDIR